MRHLASSILILGFLFLKGPLQITASGASDDPPWKRLLTGDPAKRVEELEKKIREFYETGRCPDAREPAREQGPTHWQTISAKNNLDLMTQIATLPKDAQDALTEAMKMEKNDLPKLKRESRFRDAIAMAERIVATRQRYLGDESSLMATSLYTNANFCYEQAQFAQAERLLRKALAIIKKVYGDAHPNTASAYGNLARSLDAQDKYQEARPAKEKALQIYLQAYGEESESTAIAYNNVASSQEHLGEYAEAEKGYRKAIEIFQRLHG